MANMKVKFNIIYILSLVSTLALAYALNLANATGFKASHQESLQKSHQVNYQISHQNAHAKLELVQFTTSKKDAEIAKLILRNSKDVAAGGNVNSSNIKQNFDKDSLNIIGIIGIKFTLDKGWKTYWQHTGDSGLPPRISASIATSPPMMNDANIENKDTLTDTLTDGATKASITGKSGEIVTAKMIFPAPTRFIDDFGGGITTELYGYKQQVTLPVIIGIDKGSNQNNNYSKYSENAFKLNDATGKKQEIKLALEFAICKEICIFDKAEFFFPFDGFLPKEPINSPSLVHSYPIIVPYSPISQNKESLQTTTDAKNAGNNFIQDIKLRENSLDIRADYAQHLSSVEDVFIIEKSGNFRFLRPKIIHISDNNPTQADGKKKAIITIPYEKLLETANLQGKAVNLYVTGYNRKFKQVVNIPGVILPDSYQYNNEQYYNGNQYYHGNNGDDNNEANSNKPSLLQYLLFAFIGGLMLNIMPCVLPVLSVKIFSILKKSSYITFANNGSNITNDTNHTNNANDAKPKPSKTSKVFNRQIFIIRLSFLASIMGIFSFFLMLSLLLIAIKSAGGHIGWGFQFHNPVFIGGLTLVILIFALNQFDLFEIHTPKIVNFLANKLSSSKLSKKPTTQQNTPSQDTSAEESSSIFKESNFWESFFIGVLAAVMATPCTAPYLGVAIGFALTGSHADILAILTMVATGFSLPYIIFVISPSLVKFLPKPGRWMVIFKKIMASFLLITALWLSSVLYQQLKPKPQVKNLSELKFSKSFSESIKYAESVGAEGQEGLEASKQSQKFAIWQQFSTERLQKYRTQGNKILLSVTASWCATCQVNKKTVLETEEMQNFFQANNVILLKADYTKPKEEIRKLLLLHNKYGIPFNIIYSKQHPNGLILPEILTKNLVKKGFSSINSGQ